MEGLVNDYVKLETHDSSFPRFDIQERFGREVEKLFVGLWQSDVERVFNVPRIVNLPFSSVPQKGAKTMGNSIVDYTEF